MLHKRKSSQNYRDKSKFPYFYCVPWQIEVRPHDPIDYEAYDSCYKTFTVIRDWCERTTEYPFAICTTVHARGVYVAFSSGDDAMLFRCCFETENVDSDIDFSPHWQIYLPEKEYWRIK